MVRHRCRGSRGCCSEGSYGCGSSQRLRSLPVLSSLNQRDSALLGIRVARVFSLPRGISLREDQEYLKDFNAAVDQLQKKQEKFQAEPSPFRVSLFIAQLAAHCF